MPPDLALARRSRQTRGACVALSLIHIFFATRGRGITSHVGIYIGQDKFVHAPRRGAKVRVDEMKNPYWSKRYLCLLYTSRCV